MEKDERLSRIQKLSELLNKGEEINQNLKKAIEEFKAFEKYYQEIAKYYESDELTKDLILDAAGEIPENILTGILGEDYAWDFLCDYENLKSKIKDF